MKLKKKWILVFILMNLLIGRNPAFSAEDETPVLSSSVRCQLTSSGEFSNRLRLINENMRISILTRFSGEDLEVVEPAFMSEPFLAGRLKLKGVIREFYASRPAPAGSSVFFERSGFSVTDSFSGSSRLGLVLKTDRPGSDFPGPTFWAFKTNGGNLSSGFFFDGLQLLRLGTFLMETDLIASAGTAGADIPDRWFADQPLLSAQPVINCSAEVRMIMKIPEMAIDKLPEIIVLSGRRSFRPAGEELSVALSVFGDLSLPAYSVQGHSLRGLLWFGSSSAAFLGYVNYNSADYISPAGGLWKSALSGGSKIFFRSRGSVNFNFSFEYNHCRNHPKILINRMIEQAEDVSVSAVFDSRYFRLRLNCDYNWSFDGNRSFSDSGSAAVFFRAEAEDFRLGIEAGLSGDEILNNFDRQRFKMKTGIGWIPDFLSIEADCFWRAGLQLELYEAEDAGCAVSIKVKTGAYWVSGKLSVDVYYRCNEGGVGSCIDRVVPGFSLAFESSALPVK